MSAARPPEGVQHRSAQHEGTPLNIHLDEATARAEIVRVGRSLFERG